MLYIVLVSIIQFRVLTFWRVSIEELRDQPACRYWFLEWPTRAPLHINNSFIARKTWILIQFLQEEYTFQSEHRDEWFVNLLVRVFQLYFRENIFNAIFANEVNAGTTYLLYILVISNFNIRNKINEAKYLTLAEAFRCNLYYFQCFAVLVKLAMILRKDGVD